MTTHTASPDIETCPNCEKPQPLCICDSVKPTDNDLFVLILRHPQEQDRELGTAKLTTMQLQNSMLKTGLSWPSLSKILGRTVDPKRWGVLYLGTAKSSVPLLKQPVTVLTRKGNPSENQDKQLEHIEGIILLDGNWSQAKALWWRNAWLLKCMRLVLKPPQPSLYGHLRREPRRESVSTIEAAAYTIAALADDDSLAENILMPFSSLIAKAKSTKKK